MLNACSPYFLVFVVGMFAPRRNYLIPLFLYHIVDCHRGIPMLEEHNLDRVIAWADVYATADSVCGDDDCGQGRARG